MIKLLFFVYCFLSFTSSLKVIKKVVETHEVEVNGFKFKVNFENDDEKSNSLSSKREDTTEPSDSQTS